MHAVGLCGELLRHLTLGLGICAVVVTGSVACSSSDGAETPGVADDAAAGGTTGQGGSAGNNRGGSGGTSPGGAGGMVDSGVTPTPSNDERVFVPRIVPDDPAKGIWDYRQKSTVLWFGRVDSRNNYTDVRTGYSDDVLMVRAAVFDQRIYDEAQDDALDQWDSLTLLIDLDGAQNKTSIDDRSLRIDAQALRQGSDRSVVYRGQGGQWVKANLPVGTDPSQSPLGINVSKNYRGEDRDSSRGWGVSYYLGWDVWGLSGPPSTAAQRVWRVAMIGYDRDDIAGSQRGDPQYWPSSKVDPNNPSTWGKWEFLDAHYLSWEESGSSQGQGKPSYAIQHTPAAYLESSQTTVAIRNGLDGETVENASVGASERLCSGDDGYNFGEGEDSFGDNTQRNYYHVQNQEDYADWPCFAKLYLKFPLARVPAGKVIVSATMSLHHKQPTSGGTEGERSLIQVLPVGNTLQDGVTAWNSANVTWNSAPIPFENAAGCWCDRTGNVEVGWNDLPVLSFDVARSVAAAVGDQRSHISFAIYSADSEYHTGKEFVNGGDFSDWGDPNQRPLLEITYADPQ